MRPANKIHRSNVVSMMGQRRRQCPKIKTILIYRFVLAEIIAICIILLLWHTICHMWVCEDLLYIRVYYDQLVCI